MPPRSRPRPRTYDPAKVRAALAAQTAALEKVVEGLTDEQLARPTRLGEWTVRELVAHLALQIGWTPRHIGDIPNIPTGKRELSLTEWVSGVVELAPLLDAGTREHAALAFDGGPAQVAAAFAAEADALTALLTAPESADPARRFEIRLGSMTLTDFLVTRLVETVVHADDLADALGLDSFPHDRQAVAAVTRLLADTFADRAPGGAVELRIPPYAVVQAVEGPRHTRGTPPNVVETDPLTWIRLASGRTDWAAAVDAADVAASGERSDLAGLLPVLR
ncbi:sterol carrier family protein [Kitasatospora sp. NPDC059571]|uniref:maleylpyruvate isomerase family mycothiol-dependent enzyme n=1 Tax=Kitasatospora sp. NPDC059571 TaxID=3346871 RepID=UPI0036CE2BD7